MSEWTPERLKKDRESWEAKNNSRTTNRTASTGTAAGTANTTDKWTPERIAKARESWEAKSSGQKAASPAAAAKQNTGTGLGARVLAQMTGADSSHKLQLAVPQETGRTQAYPGKNGIVTGSGTGTRSSTAQPEWLTAKSTAAQAAKVTGTVQPTERQRIAGIASGDEGWYAQTAQKVGQTLAKDRPTDTFDRLNQWMDADPKHRELVTLMRIGTGGQSYAEGNNAMQPQSVSGAAARAAVPEKSAGRRDYTDAELLGKGYSRKEISEARQYIADFYALPAWQRAVRRTADDIKGITATAGAAVPLVGETGVQSAKNAAATSSNWKQLQQDVQSDDRQQKLLRLMTGGKTRYAARDNTLQLAQSSGAMASAPAAQTTQSNAYTDAELIEKGYTQQEIDNMRARIAGTEVHDSVDPEKSLGYQLYNYGKERSAAAQAGLSPIAKQALGIVSSAGENLAVAGISPALVLPVLSAQGGAEAMGQSIEKGESAGKTLAGGLAKFGAGWAINSVGAADLAKTMGADYAKDTLAGKLADMVRSVAADGTLAQQYPAVANTISGGVDNAMQAFVETYADKAIDAALGDSEAAADLFKSDTFLTALESGLTGGASGALGGAVGTGLAKMNGGDASLVGNVKRAYYEGQVEQARQALQDEVRAQEPVAEMQQTPEEAAAGTRQPAAATQETVQPEVTGAASGFATMQDTAPMVQSKNPAVQQLAAAMQDGQLTSKTINLFTPNAANEANRAAFVEEYGIELPETAAKTRQVLREVATQQRAAQAPAAATENATVEAQKTAAIVEKMEADRSAQQAQTESELGRSGAAVENTGERVESSPAEQSGGMRETYGLEQQSLTAKQREVQQELIRWQVSDGASATISRNMPTEIGDAGRYAAAASSLYRLGQMEDVTTFNKAMELAQGMSGLAVNTDYVLAQDGGREALQLAWLQGHGELEAGNMQRVSLGGRLTAESTSGSGRVLYKGTMRTANEVGTQLIELNAKATNTDAVLKTVLQGSDRVKAYVDTETARIFFSDRAEDVFGTILHEDYHWYNSLDAEGAQALQQHALEFLAKSEGFEGIDEMIRGKLSDYAQQGLSYEEAAEELVADAWRGIFSDEASFKRWVEFQRGQAEKNAGKAGGIHKVMTKVKELLGDIVSRAKEVLARDPENKAALKAQRLAAAEKRVLQDEYFAHAERAMDSLRAAKENAAALENKGAAEGTRFEIKKDAEGETYIQIDEDILKGIPQENWKSVVKQAIRERFPDGFVRNGWTILNSKDGRNEFVWSKYSKALQWENATAYADKMRMAANLDEIIATADEVYREPADHKNAEAFNRGRIKIRVGENAYEADVLTAIKPDTREIFYDIVNIKETKIKPSGGTHVESEDSRSRLPESFSQQESADTVLKTEEGGERPSFSADTSIAQETAENKGNDGTLKKNIRLQLAAPVELYKAGDDAERTKLMNEVPNVRFQLAEQASRDAKKNDQQMASRTIADKAAALDTLSQFFGLTRGVKVSRTAIEGLASRWAKANGSKVDRAKLARETEVLVDYLKADGADMEKANALAETLAGEILNGAVYRNSELWDGYPELHKLEYTVNRSGQAKAELVKAYGSWSAAVAEARRHGVSLRQADGVRDGNPAQQYESVINDNRAVGGTSDGAKALWKAAAQQAGVDGAMSMESTEWLNVLMNLHDAIKPATMSRFADDAEYEDAKIELAGRIIGDIMATPEMTDAEAIFEGIQQHNMDVARAAAGSEERAAEVTKELRGVQKAQQREFSRRMQENRRAADQNAEVQQMTELQRQNARAEKLLDQNLETFGVDVSNVGNLNEKLTVLRESYEREMKQEVKRLKAERQEMLDEAKLEMQKLRSEKNELAWQLRQEQRRADKAEYSLIVQENEIMEWEADNERKRAAWEQKQAQRNALAIETARQQRDEDIAVAKAVAEKRVQRARDARKMDELKRSVRQNAAQLNQMLLRPSKDKYVQPGLIDAAAQVAKLADMTILNERAVNQLTRLQDRIRQSAGSESSPNAMTEEWKQTGVDTLIQTLRDDLQATKDAKLTKLHEQLAEAEALPDSEKAWALQERLRKRIRETENRTYLPMTVDQMRMLKAITSSTLHVIRNANKTVSLAKAEEVSAIAEGAASEVNASKGNHPGGKLDGMHNLLTKYQLDMLGAERVFRMLGGYAKNGQMEKMANMLNDGQYRQTKITVEGEKLFANVTGKEHVKEMQNFAGPGADLVDVGLTDVKGKKAELTHAQLCSLYMHLHNTDSLNHLMNGGLVIPDAKLYNKGDIEQAYQKGQTVHLGMLTDADGTPTADSILQTVEAAMTDYDRAWCADMKEFFDNYTTKLINETSLQLVGYQRATVKNYYPIAVDKSVLATQIDGLNLDATIEGRGFLKNRVKSGQPILLEECANVVQRSLRDTAAYAGLAAPIRDVQKILNSGVETQEGLENLKNGIIKEQWGKDAVSYIDDLLTDLQTTQRKRPSTFNKVLGNLRGNYAGAVLTLNPGVAIAQAASLPTAAAVLGGDTMAAVVPFVKNLSPKARTALETEIKEHGDVLLDWRKRGSQNGELASIGKRETLAEKGMDKLPNWLTGWINGMDEVTVAALWEGSKRYVQNHTAEFEGAEVTGSPAYWEAVNRTYQKVIEQTQPNYTVMQRAGIQRNPNELLKQLTMFTTQRFQNYGILADAIGDYKAQAERYQQNQNDENKAELQRATQQRNRAIVSQTVQTAVFAIMKIGADFLLHRWDREQDENGDVTVKSMWKRFASLYTESFAGNFLYGSELYSLIDNAMNGKDYDVLSAASISVVNDLAGDVQKFFKEFRKDTSDMDEEQLQEHHNKLMQRSMTLLEDGFEVTGVPYGNGRKLVDAVRGYAGDIENIAHGGQFSFNSVPQSATGQYDRLYNAYAGGDSDEAKAAVEKLNAMVEAGTIEENKMYSQLKSRLVKYDARVRQAAEEQNAGNDQKRYELENEMIEQLSEVLGLPKGKRGDVVDCVTGAVNQLAEKQLKGDNASVTDDLVEAVDSWDAGAVQEEYDRLAKAGKSTTILKSKITETAKPEYLAGSDADRQQMEEMLLALKDADGKELYTEKNFAQWVKEAEKKAEEGPEPDPYAAVR